MFSNQQSTSLSSSKLSSSKKIKNNCFNFPSINYEMPIDPSKNDILFLISSLFPNDDININDCNYRPFTDGLTNRLFKIHYNNKQRQILIRIYGEKTELLIDREKELQSMIVLNKAGLAPKIYGTFNNGVCYGFISGKPFSTQDMKDSLKSKLVAQQLAKFHSVNIPTIDHSPSLFITLNKWLQQIEKPILSRSYNEVKNGYFSLNSFTNEMNWLNNEMNNNFNDWDISFCHNDLLAGNIIFKDNNVHFIDYEYGSYNYSLFDIGNHFCEMMGQEVNLSLFPSKHFQREWISNYLEYKGLSVNQTIISQTYKKTKYMILAANLYWGIWSLLQSQFSNVDYDYKEYSRLKLYAYYTLKDQLFGKII